MVWERRRAPSVQHDGHFLKYVRDLSCACEHFAQFVMLRVYVKVTNDEVRFPMGGSWPALMRADMAAAYLDEPDRTSFLRKVRNGIYPAAVRFPGCRLRWRKSDLDAAIFGVKITASLDDDL